MINFDAVLAAAEAAFGEPVIYYPALAGPIALAGIFNDRYQQTKLQDGIEIVDFAIVLGIRAALFNIEPLQGDLFRIRGIFYVISGPVEPDGMGDLKITLRAASNSEAARLRLPPGSL